jgi:hypothetical protein
MGASWTWAKLPLSFSVLAAVVEAVVDALVVSSDVVVLVDEPPPPPPPHPARRKSIATKERPKRRIFMPGNVGHTVYLFTSLRDLR